MRDSAPGRSPVVSICIPTFDRRAALKQTLDALIPLVKELRGEAEICVSDNCSTDGTYEMLRSYAARLAFLRISRNKSNLGFDRNVLAALHLAKGDYCWPMSDDDTIIPGAILRMVASLKNGPEYAAGFIAALSERDAEGLRRFFPKDTYTVKEFAQRSGPAMRAHEASGLVCSGFISNYLLNRRLLENGGYDAVRGHQNGFCHASLFSYCIRNPKARVFIFHDLTVKASRLRDQIYLPPQYLEVFFYNRLDSFTYPPIRSPLTAPFREYMNRIAGIRYSAAIARLLCFHGLIDDGRYRMMKQRTYSLGNKLDLPLHYKFAVLLLKYAEYIAPLRWLVCGLYTWKTGYGKVAREYVHGRLKTNREREEINVG